MIRSNHRFLWDDDTEPEDWENRLAKKYYSKLFKEYCICDLSHYKDNKIAMRWRTEAEVVAGKGQFVCGSKCCPEKKELRSWEVNFTYVEGSQKKTALVKLRLCSSCSRKLNYRSQKRLAKKQKRLKTFKESAGPGPTMSFSAHETEDPLNTEEGDAQEKLISASNTESKEKNVWSEKGMCRDVVKFYATILRRSFQCMSRRRAERKSLANTWRICFFNN